MLLIGGTGPGGRLIFVVAAPRSDVPARGWVSFFCRYRNECLGVEWEVSLCLGLVFSWGGQGPC